ncbi:hypothetical protein Dimus_011921 [Dionaea muscipula]
MNCLPCFSSKDKNTDKSPSQEKQQPVAGTPQEAGESSSSSSSGKTFTFRELAMATKNFRQECLLGEGGFGRVYKGTLHSNGQVVAVKQLDRNGMQENNEFLVEVSLLSLLHHPNLVNLIGHCADGDQRLLVYEFMPVGSLENHLFGDNADKKKPLNWLTRMKIASGAAKGLEYLHEKANPPIIYRDLKPSNILLDEDFEPKLSDFGLAKLGTGGGRMGTYGYSAPEYTSGGELTLKSDIYSFGVVLLELITGRRAIDTTRPNAEQNLVTWAQPIFRDPKRFSEMADPQLNKEFPVTGLNQAVGVAAMCLQEESSVRPLISDVVSALGFISTATADSEENPNAFAPPPEQKMDYESEVHRNSSAAQSEKNGSDRDHGSSSGSDDDDDEGSVDQQNECCDDDQRKGGGGGGGGGECSYRGSDHGDDSDDSEGSARYKDADSAEDDEEEEEEKTNEPTHDQEDKEANTINTTSRAPSSKKLQEFGNASSRRSNSRTPSSRRPKGSSRHRVVKFKDPGSNMIRSGSEISEDGSFS